MSPASPSSPDAPAVAPVPPEERTEFLRAELEATADRSRKALLHYEIGHIAQHAMENEAQAVREYLQAYNLDAQFRPPLLALISIFERRRSNKNLMRLYEAEARSATQPPEAASAIADRATLMADHAGQPEEARALLESAFEQAPEANDIALLLEHQLFVEGDREAALAVVEKRAATVDDPVLATLLRLEVAREREDAGDHEGAIEALKGAASTPAARWRVLEALERVARSAEKAPELVVALDGRARLATAESRGEDQGQASGAFSIQRFADQARAQAEAAALHREAARVRIQKLGDPAGAIASYDQAIVLHPDDVLLRYERMLACELAGEVEAAADEASSLLERIESGPAAAALRFRLAERAQVAGDPDAALEALEKALEADPGSAVATAMLDDLRRARGDFAAASADLEARAEGQPPEIAAARLWEAAHLAAFEQQDAERARALYTAAAAAAPRRDPYGAPAILREALTVALTLSDAEGANQHLTALLELEIDDAERGALLRDAHELRRFLLEDEEAADQTLLTAIASEGARAWAPDVARLSGALGHNAGLLAAAHHALADRAADAETAAAHLCAAARVLARTGDEDGAVAALRSAVERSPTHPYAIALLEEVFRARGDADEVVKLLREAAEKSDAPGAAVTRLLLAGAAAEAADDFDKAVQTYNEAAEKDPTSLAPPLALKRLAEARGDSSLLLLALEALSAREIAAGAPGRHTLALGEHYDLTSGKPELAETPLRTVLQSETVGLHAAVDLSLLRLSGTDGAPRLAGLERMLTVAPPEARRGLWREAAGTALSATEDLDGAAAHLDALAEHSSEDRWGPIGRLRLIAMDPARAQGGTSRADAWLALGHATDDPEVGAELLLAGLRAHSLGAGEEAVDDAVILAHEVMAVAPDSLAASVALDETLAAGDDPDGRADALGSWMNHAGGEGKVAMESARGRALAAAGRAREGLEVLLRVAAREPEDLASWESIRVCARDCEAWAPLVEACDRLAHLIDDEELTMLLLEESAATLMDELHQDQRAERRLRRILAIDARRPIAYGRLHDVLAERGDDAGLLDLVSRRIELVDDVEELGKLFYEQARLFRSIGERDAALGALDNLLMLESGHVGGLALLVELQVQLENFEGAVEALRSLADADDVPDSQRRIARLGAADFLENKLGDGEGALGELVTLANAGLGDLALYERIASLAEALERPDDAVAALEQAAASGPGADAVARLERRAGGIHAGARDDAEAAIAAYERALAAAPTDLEAAEAMVALMDLPNRQAASARFEGAVRESLRARPLDADAVRKLRRVAAWRDDAGLDRVALAGLLALGAAGEEEYAAYRASAIGRASPQGALEPAALDALRAPGDSGPVLAIARALSESVAEMDGLDASGFGLGRGDLVKGDSPLKAELRAIGAAFGLPDAELYVGGDDANRLDLMPYYKGSLTWVCGANVGSLDTAQRFAAGMLAMGAALGIAPLVRRGAQGASTAIFAAASAAEAPLALGEGRAGMAETKRRIYKAMPRRVRKALPALLAPIAGDGGRAVDAWAERMAMSGLRAGVVLADDLDVGLQRALGRASDAEALSAAPSAHELYVFWLSPGALALRRTLGLSA